MVLRLKLLVQFFSELHELVVDFLRGAGERVCVLSVFGNASTHEGVFAKKRGFAARVFLVDLHHRNFSEGDSKEVTVAFALHVLAERGLAEDVGVGDAGESNFCHRKHAVHATLLTLVGKICREYCKAMIQHFFHRPL